MARIGVASLFALLVLSRPALSATPPPAGGVRFTEVTREAGINFNHSFGDKTFSNIVEAVGSGAAWLDYDRDGRMDLYLLTAKYRPGVSQGERPEREETNRLYRGRGDGTFEDVTARAGVACKGCFSLGVAVGDYDNDGWPDIYVTNDGGNVLYHNRGDGTFTDETRRAGVGNGGCSVAATWFDFDRDGLLDLYVGNYLEFDPKYAAYYSPDGFPGPTAYRPQPDALYRNLGGGRFEDVTARMGLTGLGRAMSVAAGDIDGDGWDDVYVTNDASANFLLVNRQGRRFEDVALREGVAFNGMGDQTASMAVDFGDFDGDGRPDIFVSDNAFSSLYHNDGGSFTDEAAEAGIARASAQFVGWGSFFFDYDNDGDLDIFKANSDLSRLFGQEDQIFENEGGRYRDASTSLGPYFREARMGRGAAYADYDNDGDLDIIVVNLVGPPTLLRNDGGNRNHAIVLRLAGRTSNRDGVGAKVKVVANGRTQTAEKRSSGGYLSQNDPRLFFGIGQARAADRVEVVWPSGRTQVLTNVAPGTTVDVEEPQ